MTALTGFRHADMVWGESLQAFALRELGDAARWGEIVDINNLIPPYVTSDPAQIRDGVVPYSTPLLVPSPQRQVESTSPDRLFERDIALVDGRLTIGEEGTAGSGVGVVSGIENLSQALRHRIETDHDELLFHPRYGCRIREIIGTTNTRPSSTLSREYIRAALLSDPRIKDVRTMRINAAGDSINIQAEAIPITGRAVDVDFGATVR